MQELEKQNKKENKNPLFLKAKEQAIKYLEKYHGPNVDDWGNDKIDKVANLKDFPEAGHQVRHVAASAKAILIKAHLKQLYPNAKFSVVKPHYGALHIKFIDGEYPFGVQQKIENAYVDAGQSDLMTDYFDYDLHILFINGKNGAQHFYKDIGEAIKDLDELIQKKKISNKDYYDKEINYLVGLVGVKE